ncbi:hypothetical protein TgHK011_003839 [Trichoderma gracile]|nr:hypothetical protein TgHK011_003839 [Trichoderma gracile]
MRPPAMVNRASQAAAQGMRSAYVPLLELLRPDVDGDSAPTLRDLEGQQRREGCGMAEGRRDERRQQRRDWFGNMMRNGSPGAEREKAGYKYEDGGEAQAGRFQLPPRWLDGWKEASVLIVESRPTARGRRCKKHWGGDAWKYQGTRAVRQRHGGETAGTRQ